MSVKKIKLPDGSVVDINDSRIHIYRTLTGTAADTVSPYSHTKWDVTDSTITEYVDGMVVCLKVPVAGNGTYGTGLQINDLGYKPVVYNVNSAISTRYSVGSIIWCVYNATQTGSLYINSTSAVTVTGCWQVQDYDANTMGYQLRTNLSTRPVSSDTYRYRLMFSSLDDAKWVPATNSTSTNATSSRPVNQEVINPLGRIVYYSITTAKTAGQSLSATAQWDRYTFDLGYSFNDGTALNLTFPGPVYIKCTPQAGGGAIIDSTTPYTQSLPSTADGKIYIYLGQAYSASEVELIDYHPVLYHDGSKITMWTGTVSGGLTNYDFTHTANTTISSSTTTVTFATNTRGTAMLTISADLGLTIACNNGSDNYIWVKNTGSSEVDITISAVTQNSTNVSNVYMPSDGITVPAGGLCEIGIIVNTDGAFITSRNDLAL